MNITLHALQVWTARIQKKLLHLSNTASKRGIIFLILFLLSFILYFPDYQNIFAEGAHEGLENRIAFPLTPNESPNDTHTAKTEFRLFVPLLGKLLRLNGVQLAFMVQLLAYFFYFLAFQLFRRLTRDRLSALLLTSAIAFSYFGKAFNSSYFYDAYALILLVWAALLHKTWWQVPILIFAGFVDERAIIAILILPLFNTYLTGNPSQGRFNLAGIDLLSRSFIMPFMSVMLILMTRFLLGHYFQLTTPVGDENGVGLAILYQNYKWFPLASLSAMEGFWILMILGLLYLVIQKKHLQVLMILLYTGLLMSIAFCVIDVTRSMSYLILLPFLMAVFLRDLDMRMKRNICLTILLFNLIFPNYYIYGGPDDYSFWLSPIVPKIFKMI